MRLLLAEVLDDGLATGAEGVTGVEDVDDDVGRVEHLVELSPDTTRGSLGVDGLRGERARGVVGGGDVLLGVEGDAERGVGDGRALSELLNASDIETGTLALRLGAERVRERLRLDDVHLLALRLALVLEQAHRELVPLQEHRVRVFLVLRERGTEVVQCRLRDNSRVAEPSSVGLDAAGGRLLALERGGLDDLAVLVAHGLAAVQHLLARGILGGNVEVFTWLSAEIPNDQQAGKLRRLGRTTQRASGTHP